LEGPTELKLTLFIKSIHRVAVINEEGVIIGIVSQSNIIKFMAENIHSMNKEFCRSTLVDLGYGKAIFN